MTHNEIESLMNLLRAIFCAEIGIVGLLLLLIAFVARWRWDCQRNRPPQIIEPEDY